MMSDTMTKQPNSEATLKNHSSQNENLLRSSRFRKEREHIWNHLEKLVDRVERKGKGALNTEELLELPGLYRNILAALAIARAYVLDIHLVRYLDSLALRTHLVVFSPRESASSVVHRLFTQDIPQAVRNLVLPVLLSGAILFLGILIGYYIILERPDLFDSVVSAEMAQGRTPLASTSDLEKSISGGGVTLEQLQLLALHLIRNNVLVSLMCIGFGLVLGIPTALLLLYNGVLIGALIGVFALRDLGVDFIAWLSVHGTTELGAIIIAGGAGFAIAGSILFPAQRQSRLASAKLMGGKVASLTVLVIVMLIVAGFLEAFPRQLVEETPARFLIGATFATLWIYYFTRVGRNDRRSN